MSKVLYEASPSMIRMDPFGMLVMILLLFAGIALALPPVADALTAMIGIEQLQSQYLSIAGMVIAALVFLRLLAWYVSTKADLLTIKEDELVWTHGLLNKQYTEINMSSVRTVKVSQSILQRIMGAGDIKVFTSGDIPELVVKGLPDPDKIREYLKGQPKSESGE